MVLVGEDRPEPIHGRRQHPGSRRLLTAVPIQFRKERVLFSLRLSVLIARRQIFHF